MTGQGIQSSALSPSSAKSDARIAAEMAVAFLSAFRRPADAMAVAPGRIEFVGNHTDYNGGLVLGAAIDRGICVAVAKRTDGRRRLATTLRPSEVVDLAASTFKKHTGAASWTNYPLGVLQVLEGEGCHLRGGFDLLVHSTLPAGSGLSSSAALELASAFVFLELADRTLPLERMVTLCRRAENEFVGVPCGILDQAVSGFGRENHLVRVDCRGPQFETLALPDGLFFWVFNTHVQHALVDGLYSARHRECLEAARALRVPLLSDASEESLDKAGRQLPDVLARRARHIIGEISRVRRTGTLLEAGDLRAVGRVLNESHESSRRNFENSTPELDFLVTFSSQLPGVYGARLTGGGFGGAVLVVTDASFDSVSARVVEHSYAAKFGAKPEVLRLRTGNGARLLRMDLAAERSGA